LQKKKKHSTMNFIDDSLTLALGFPSSNNQTRLAPDVKPQHVVFTGYEPSLLTLGLTADQVIRKDEPRGSNNISAASSLSNNNTNVVLSVKRERETTSYDDEDEDDTCHALTTTTRKKLRLNKEQSVLLEEHFKLHSTLNPKQKQALAERLNLRPRQVEVWFQNRRARTKLKQTEVDCEYMKKWCETLREENRKLQKELHELKSLNLINPFYMHLPASTITMCPSCETIAGTNNLPNNKPFIVAPNSHFYAPTAPNRPLLVDN